MMKTDYFRTALLKHISFTKKIIQQFLVLFEKCFYGLNLHELEQKLHHP